MSGSGEITAQLPHVATYVFPVSPVGNAVNPADGSSVVTTVSSGVEKTTESEGFVSGSLSKDPAGPINMPRTVGTVGTRGHIRSASHGGTASPGAGVVGVVGRPSALKKGHARAFSQGQIVDGSSSGQGLRGHSRVGSKTDFILPPGHQDRESRIHNQISRTDSVGFGHSRQASRSESIYTLRQHVPSLSDRVFFWRRKKDGAEDSHYRRIVPNHMVPPNIPKNQHPNSIYPTNQIRTSKYTILSFLPKNLLEQFHRVANLYFLFIVLLNWFPAINAFGKEVAMIPVLFVLGVTAIKDMFEDRRRHNSDKRINNSTCRVFRR